MDPFTNKVYGSCAGKNIDGLVEIHASDKELADQLVEILSESSARNEIPLEGSGMEYILYQLSHSHIKKVLRRKSATEHRRL